MDVDQMFEAVEKKTEAPPPTGASTEPIVVEEEEAEPVAGPSNTRYFNFPSSFTIITPTKLAKFSPNLKWKPLSHPKMQRFRSNQPHFSPPFRPDGTTSFVFSIFIY